MLLGLTGCHRNQQVVCEKDYVVNGSLVHETYRDKLVNDYTVERLHTFQISDLKENVDDWFLTQLPQKEIVMFKEILNQEHLRFTMVSTDQDYNTGTFLISHRYLFDMMSKEELHIVSTTFEQSVLSLEALQTYRTQQNFKCTL
ncbi:hypothetical protein LLS04_00365 [Erysipelothrix enhydrae]|uniref:hypothetical protein n=1 Tax=Erysipelothrix enhydrae TaxID=2890314 RepID=UPI002B243374|nr:hypothetical protein [Erysipelothrix sp. 4322-04]WRB87802.1 hypothetical protein LLS04_00365 [Erysipelothrix sp. 4322-04]